MTVRLIFGRPLPGTVRETRQVVPELLMVLCGTSFRHGRLGKLNNLQSLPCESCSRRTSQLVTRRTVLILKARHLYAVYRISSSAAH